MTKNEKWLADNINYYLGMNDLARAKYYLRRLSDYSGSPEEAIKIVIEDDIS